MPATARAAGRPSREALKRKFAQRLIAIMDRSGLSLAETARRVRQNLGTEDGFTDANLVHYRQGRSLPRPRYLEALSHALEVDPNDLITGGPSSPQKAKPSSKATRPARAAASGAAARAHKVAGETITTNDAFRSAGVVIIEDYGDEVHLKLDQRLPWLVALQILQAVKSPRLDEASPVSRKGTPAVRRPSTTVRAATPLAPDTMAATFEDPVAR